MLLDFILQFCLHKFPRKILNRDEKPTREEAKLSNKIILKKIVVYALPFIVIELIRSINNTVDTFTVVRTLSAIGYYVSDAEKILSIITTWGAKLTIIIMSISYGLVLSLIKLDLLQMVHIQQVETADPFVMVLEI